MRKALAAVVVAMMGIGPVHADVKVVRSVKSDGVMGMGAGIKEMTQWIAADRHREEQKTEGKPSFVERMAGVGRPIITRLDKKVRWTLNLPKKTYQEAPLVEPPAASDSAESSGPESSGPEGKPTLKITKAEFKVTPLGQKKKIGAFDCEGYVLRAVLETEDLESHERSAMRMVTTLWNAAETGAVAQVKKEEEAYGRAYHKAIGLDATSKATLSMIGGAMVASLAGAGENELSSALSGMPAELKKMKGYPISTRVEWYGEDDSDKKGESAEEERAEIPTDVSDALGSLAAGFAKKKLAAKKPSPTADGRLMFAMTTEIQAIDTTPLPPDTFEVPAQFKKVR